MDTARPQWRSAAWLTTLVLLCVILLVLSLFGASTTEARWGLIGAAALVTLLVIFRTYLRVRAQRRRYEDELARWAAERATQAERLRIAADLHDLVSHGLGLITVRAAAARGIASSIDGSEQTAALADIERASRKTTTELRRMLTVLRDPGAAPLRPADSLASLPAMVQAANDTGLKVALRVEEVDDVSPGVQLTVCAVVRESLSNTLRHAGPTEARVVVRREAHEVLVSVHDAGPRGLWQSQPGAGHGLDGMRERLAVHGGTLEVGAFTGGFRVCARIPDGDRL